MAARGVSRGCIAVALLVAGCSGDDTDAESTTTAAPTTTTLITTTTAPERPASTTTTTFDPASVEGEVEAAYLRSWDVYADAVYNLELDEAALEAVYTGEGLSNVLREIEDRIEEGRAALVEIEHSYQVVVTDEQAASVIDDLTNHQVLIDPATKEPIESDPNDRQLLNFVMTRAGSGWKVALIGRMN